ncbi:hypothetical protein QJS04_geneDACA011770 [Acorus gramineus]|uniref:Uncharacterized protein n=1 Tax=Acorus gramineus TaxID=55184 RepID=A0AAV9BL62_ACOGR|nr:hypothetical protein QJS04_geneDACA011770 [Acorus gramineus]
MGRVMQIQICQLKALHWILKNLQISWIWEARLYGAVSNTFFTGTFGLLAPTIIRLNT